MKMSESRAKLARNPHGLSRTESLLIQYPQLSSEELKEVGQYLRRASPMDMGLLSTNQEAWSNAERYRREHPSVFAATVKEKLVWAVATIAVVAILALLWDSGLGR